ncbi:TetR family transcriptional regulator [Streptomyces sp. NPDC029006]|uniref:TetR/AcrR family transcriptional regulator n=1 Tax=Streptomyces sp. NPDC029006 TaxID=3155467 RepID=UPI0033DE43E4
MTASPAEGRASARLRTDAARNRAQILSAARSAFLEAGTAVPLEEIARRAGVNIATLYRRFAGREALIAQVVIEGFGIVLDAARAAVPQARTDPPAAVEAFLRAMIDSRDLLVLPLIGGPQTDAPEARELQREIATALEEILAEGRRHNVIRADVTAVDLITTAALLCRPLPHLPPEQAAALTARHVGVFLDGLRPGQSRILPPAPSPEEMAGHLHGSRGETARGQADMA